MEEGSFKKDLVERRRRRAMGFREKGEQFPNSKPRERKGKENEDILAQKHINILSREITIMPLPLYVLNTTLRLSSYLTVVT
jgi:hypothetical protein